MSFAPLIEWMKNPLSEDVTNTFLQITKVETLANIFRIPVLDAYADNKTMCNLYRQNIRHPCAFQDILRNLNDRHYVNIGQLSYHFLLMVGNSIQFNVAKGQSFDGALKNKDCTAIIHATGMLYDEILSVFKRYVATGAIHSARPKHFPKILDEVKAHFECPVNMSSLNARKSVSKQNSDALDLLFAPVSTEAQRDAADPKRSSSKKVTFGLPSTINSTKLDSGSLTPINSSTMMTATMKESQAKRKRTKSPVGQPKALYTPLQSTLYQSQQSFIDIGASAVMQDLSNDPIRDRNMMLFANATRLRSYSREKKEQVFARIRAFLGIDKSIRDIDLNFYCKTEAQLLEVFNIISRG